MPKVLKSVSCLLLLLISNRLDLLYIRKQKKASSPNDKRDKYVNFLRNAQSTVLQLNSYN